MLSRDGAARRHRRSAATQGNWYNALLARLRRRGRVKAPLADASLVNGWGLSAGPTTPWWTSNNKTNTSTLYSGAGVKSALTVTVPGGPTGTVFNGERRRIHRQRQRQERRRSLPLRDCRRGRSSAGHRPSTRTPPSRPSTTPRKARCTTGSRRSTTASTRPTSTTLASTSSTRASPPSRSPTASSTSRSRRAGRRSASRRWAGTSSSPTRSRTPAKPRRPRRRARLRRPVRPQRRAARTRRQARLPESAAQLALGTRDGAGNLRRLRRRPSRRQLREREDQRLPAAAVPPGKWIYKGQLRSLNGEIIKIPGLWAIAFGNGSAAGSANNLYFLSGPNGETHGLFGVITVG